MAALHFYKTVKKLLPCHILDGYFTSDFIYLRISSNPILGEKPGMNCSDKVNCDKFGTRSRRRKCGRHVKGSSTGTLHYTQCPNFSKLPRLSAL